MDKWTFSRSFRKKMCENEKDKITITTDPRFYDHTLKNKKQIKN